MKQCYIWKIKKNKLIKLGLLKKEEDFIFEPNKNISKEDFNQLILSKDGDLNYESIKNSIRDASPDAWGRNLIQYLKNKSYEEINEIEYLLSSNEDRIGDFIFTKENSIKEALEILYKNNIDVEFNYDSFIQFIQNVQKTTQSSLDRNLISAIVHGTSVGGARPKAVVNYDGGKYLAKFNTSTDIYNVIESEFVGMQLAEKIGLNVAKTKLIKAENKTILLVERFD